MLPPYTETSFSFKFVAILFNTLKSYFASLFEQTLRVTG